MAKEENRFYVLDRNSLDDEWEKQAGLMYRHCKRLADAELEMDSRKADLELTVAELDQTLREEFEQKERKVTEPAIEKAIIRHRRYKKAQLSLIDARYKVSVLKGAVRALDHKKSAIEGLQFLWAKEFWASPKVPEGEDGEELTRRKRSKVRRG